MASLTLLTPISANSVLRPATVKGSKIRAEIIMRQKAITSEGTASFWARRIKIEPEEMAKMPIVSTTNCSVRGGVLNGSGIV